MRGIDALMEMSYEQAKSNLLPIVRDAYQLALRYLVDEYGDAGANATPVQRPLFTDCSLGIAIDQPRALALVTKRLQAEWGLSYEELLEVALQNLRNRSTVEAWKQVAPGVWSAAWRDEYESSRIALPELVAKLPVKDPVAMVPFRNTMLVTSGANPQAVGLMARLVQQQMEVNAQWVSFRLLALKGGQWVETDAPAPAQEVLRELELRRIASVYGQQADALNKRYKSDGTDVFVSTLRLGKRADTPLMSMTIWNSGVDSLLPKAHMVAMGFIGAHGLTAAVLPWAEVVERFGNLLEKTDLYPVRYKTKGFPSKEVFERLPQAQRISTRGASPS